MIDHQPLPCNRSPTISSHVVLGAITSCLLRARNVTFSIHEGTLIYVHSYGRVSVYLVRLTKQAVLLFGCLALHSGETIRYTHFLLSEIVSELSQLDNWNLIILLTELKRMCDLCCAIDVEDEYLFFFINAFKILSIIPNK